ncbi:translation initiation factor IF-2 subunit beta [Candidatus Woesearchaeota archaeon]|nr:translation initiation factor IF-2 subunit beta [Candidatus Woesearchaeota archaeon]
MNYKGLLKDARKNLPESVFEKQRFEIPKVRGHLQGNMTVISNFKQIAQSLGRRPEHLLKYILKELAAPGNMKPKGLLIGTKAAASKVNEKIKQYAHEYVLCSECGKPDTIIEKDDQFSYLKCNACGARHSVKSKI